MTTLTKSQVVENIYEVLGRPHTKEKSVKVVESLIEIIKRTLESGEDILVSGFGKFCVKEKKPRKGRNPATDEDMMLDARRVVTFKCSGKLRKRLNG